MVLALIGTGVALGIVHVLTGPDHLSALATLSANNDSHTAFFLGVRWGVGHSTGLLTVGVVFILMSLSSNQETIEIPEGVSHFFESIVGIFMILLGIYGIRRAHHRKNTELLSDRDGLTRVAMQEDWDASVIRSRAGEGAVDDDEQNNRDEDEQKENYETFPATGTYAHSDHAHPRHSTFFSVDEETMGTSRCQMCTSKLSTGMMALVAGIIHGLAGPGGVLGVIPAVQMHNSRLAAVYLGSFCIASTLTMGLFAVLYGTSTVTLGKRWKSEFLVEMVSASFSIFVGVLWIVLLSVGKLDDIFP
ncbi:hypothetical protein FisN_1Lh317 [Fistulifera solaris]|uniref:Uncharacterized protein n=1 Tax=Fistulifera solaris TaxID=1519565 RepID=A0A1Z5K429_FISSO|nr:hypothetical protein FisN_1Lh317 [Fistulifera solaris]|eukprot:GAX21013.1 hypothetical protein FisN_1Lh317 [Fistulifera solaris]